jgi:hypothetical protein
MIALRLPRWMRNGDFGGIISAGFSPPTQVLKSPLRALQKYWAEAERSSECKRLIASGLHQDAVPVPPNPASIAEFEPLGTLFALTRYLPTSKISTTQIGSGSPIPLGSRLL